MHLIQLISYVWLACIPTGGWAQAGRGDVSSGVNLYTYGAALATDQPLVQAIRRQGVSSIFLHDDELALFTFPKGSTLLVDGDQPMSPESRRALYQLRRNNGQIFVFGKGAFHYSPLPHRSVSLANLADSSQYRIARQVRRIKAASYENPVIETIVTDRGTTGLSFRTERRGMPDILVHLKPGDKATNSRSVLLLRARGNVYMDLLSVEITDRYARKWLGFIPIGKQWQDYSLSLADCIPEGWNKANECYPLLSPADIRDIALGTNMLTVWREQPMEFAISDVALAEDTSGYYTPTGHNRSLRLPFAENNTCIPSWLLDERGSQYVEFPGSATGTDNKKEYDRSAERVIRTLNPMPDATVQIAGDGSFSGSAFGVFPQPLTVIQADPKRTASVARFILNMTRCPRITAVLPDVAQSGIGNYQFALHVTVHNFQGQTVKGKLEVNIGDSLYAAQEDIRLGPYTSRTVLVGFPPIAPSFPFAKFCWNVRFQAGGYTDILSDSVNVERAILHSFIHMRNVQQQYTDGRFSHHYFGDAYGARAQLAYLAYLQVHPDSKQKNMDLWQRISEWDIWRSGTRFFDMLVEKQDADGGLPMGYSEHTGGRNVADGGQMALSVAQSLRYVTDSTKARAYSLLCRRFFNWAETFYIDEAKAADLADSHPESAAKGHANAGHYGLGRSRRKVNPTGPLWVLSDILAFQLLWAKLSGEPEAEYIARRNKAYYVSTRHSAQGYYQAEALCWAWMDSPGNSLQSDIAKLLRDTYVPALLEGGPRDMFLLGGRNTLKALPLLYYRQHIEDNPALRAALLKYVWSYASENAPGAIKQLTQQFPKPVHGESLMAIKYAALSALWAMELLQPGCTLHPALFQETANVGFENTKQHPILRNNQHRSITPPSAEQVSTKPSHKVHTREVKVYRNLRYGENPQDVYAKDTSSDRLLDLYLPINEAGVKRPVILFVHGGGFGGGDKSAHEEFFRNLASHDFAVISINYRLYLKHHKISGASASANMAKGLRADGKFHPELQTAVRIASDDASEVLRWIKSNADAYNMDAGGVTVSGGSAGAMTVLHLAYASMQQVLPIRAVVNMWGGLQDVAVIHAGAPPLLTFHGDKDALIHVDYAHALDDQMKKIGSLSELYVLEGKGHAIYNIISRDHVNTIVAFLRKVLIEKNIVE